MKNWILEAEQSIYYFFDIDSVPFIILFVAVLDATVMILWALVILEVL